MSWPQKNSHKLNVLKILFQANLELSLIAFLLTALRHLSHLNQNPEEAGLSWQTKFLFLFSNGEKDQNF